MSGAPAGDEATGDRPVIRVVVVDDEAMLREALVALLDFEADLEVIEAADGPAALRHAPSADVVVLDLAMPGMDGIETAARLRARHRSPGIVMITRHAAPGTLVRALDAGVNAFVLKSTRPAELAAIIRKVHAGGRYVDPELAALALDARCPLSDRELDVLRHTRDGLSVAQIAAAEALAAGTVRNYLSSAVRKSGTSNRHAATAWAQRQGWL